MKKRIIIISVVIITIILASVGGVVYYNIRKVEKQQQITSEKISEITDRVMKLYETEEKELLKEDILQEDINQILQSIEELLRENLVDEDINKLNDIKKELVQIQEMLDISNRVKEFEGDLGELLSDDVITEIEEAIEAWEEIKPIFFNKLKEKIETIKLLNEARRVVYELFSDSTYEVIKEEITTEQISSAKEKVEEIEEGDIKEGLISLIANAEAKLNQREQENNKKNTNQSSNNSNSSGNSSSNSSSGNNSSNNSSSGETGTSDIPSVEQRDAEARVIAKQIANSIGPGTDEERIRAAALKVSQYYDRGVHKESGPYYNTPYGVFIAGESSCAGCTRALLMVLSYMGYSGTHVNQGQWTHQWVIIEMDGQTGWADGQIGGAGYGAHPYI